MRNSVFKRLRYLLLVPFLTACGDAIGPQFWVARPDTLVIHSVSREEFVGYLSAVDLIAEPITPLPIEVQGVTGNWDFALVDAGGGLALLPSAALPGMGIRSRIAMLRGVRFDDLEEAPRDTAAYSAGAVPLLPDAVYVIRTRRAACGFSQGYRYAKLEPIEINQQRGILRFAVVRNPYCDDRSFVPPN
jgi:hypothetical protein